MLFAKYCLVIGTLMSLAVAAPVSVPGHWELHADFDDRRIPGAFAQCTFTQSGRRLTGTCEDATVDGDVDADKVIWRLTLGATHDVVSFTGMLDDEDPVILGRFTYPGKGDGSFLAIKR
jgi:hypothetical protein